MIGLGPMRGISTMFDTLDDGGDAGDHRQERDAGDHRRVAQRVLQVVGEEQEDAEHAGARR